MDIKDEMSWRKSAPQSDGAMSLSSFIQGFISKVWSWCSLFLQVTRRISVVCWSEGWEWEIRPIFGWNSQCFGGTESRNASKASRKNSCFDWRPVTRTFSHEPDPAS